MVIEDYNEPFVSFSVPCFVRINTPELRAALEDLGYADIHQWAACVRDGCPVLQVYTGYYMYEKSVADVLPGAIDCGYNEELFMALAAIRPDSDRGQWFTDGHGWTVCETDDFSDRGLTGFHKAAVAELMERYCADN